jgi:hypothetical protein
MRRTKLGGVTKVCEKGDRLLCVITKHDLKLVQCLYVWWDDTTYEHGAPAVDVKRPFGVGRDPYYGACVILGWVQEGQTATPAQLRRAKHIYEKLEYVTQIVLQNPGSALQPDSIWTRSVFNWRWTQMVPRRDEHGRRPRRFRSASVS